MAASERPPNPALPRAEFYQYLGKGLAPTKKGSSSASMKL